MVLAGLIAAVKGTQRSEWFLQVVDACMQVLLPQHYLILADESFA